MRGHGLVVAAEGLADGHRGGQPPGIRQARDGAREGDRQRAAVGHHVGDPGARVHGPDAGEHGRQGGVQVGDDDRHPAEVVGLGELGVVRAVLLVDGEQHLLHRGVPRLDDVPGPGRWVGRQVVGAGDDERQATGAQPPEQGRRVEQDPLTGPWCPHHGRVGEGAHGRVGDVVEGHRALHGTRPAAHLLR